MAGWPHRLDFHKYCVLITIQADSFHLLEVSGRLAFMPELLTAPAPEVRLIPLERELQCFLIHICDGEHLASAGILNNSRNKTVGSEFRAVQNRVHRTTTPRALK